MVEKALEQNRKKDIEVFNKMYVKYAPALYGIILKLEPRQEHACLILQRSFVRISKDFHDYDHTTTALFPWMVGITLKECKSVISTQQINLLEKVMPRRLFKWFQV
ncbi:MAG TPA: hypothetical protein VM012_07560 [Flavitalea sp.]|nr:hypothetical protein [Flavitalea sp.]